MIKQKRYERILDLINEQHAVSIDELCDRLGVSMATVRRDLIYLDEQKMLKRTHGGAISLVKPAVENVPITLRCSLFKDEKVRIARAALEMIRDGTTVFLGSGTTVQELASLLSCFSQLTVVTNDIGVAHTISHTTTNRLIVSGGNLRQATTSLVGCFAEGTLRDLRAEIAFLSADAVAASGFMDVNTEEATIKRMMLANARRRVMLCDHSKFGASAFMTVCPLSAADVTLTNRKLPPTLDRELTDGGITLQVV